MKLHKILMAATACAALLSPVGASAEGVKKIGLAVPNLQADFFNQIKQSVEAEGKAKGVKVITVDAQGNSSTQVSQIEDLITRQIDVLIYIPAGATATSMVRDCKAFSSFSGAASSPSNWTSGNPTAGFPPATAAKPI